MTDQLLCFLKPQGSREEAFYLLYAYHLFRDYMIIVWLSILMFVKGYVVICVGERD